MSHALLSPSSAKRWFACSPSARLEAKLPETTSDYAKEGTLAHKLAELLLMVQYGKGPAHLIAKQLNIVKANKLYNLVMRDHIEIFIAYIHNLGVHAATLFLETTLDLSHVIPQSFGTGDIAFVLEKTL